MSLHLKKHTLVHKPRYCPFSLPAQLIHSINTTWQIQSEIGTMVQYKISASGFRLSANFCRVKKKKTKNLHQMISYTFKTALSGGWERRMRHLVKILRKIQTHFYSISTHLLQDVIICSKKCKISAISVQKAVITHRHTLLDHFISITQIIQTASLSGLGIFICIYCYIAQKCFKAISVSPIVISLGTKKTLN